MRNALISRALIFGDGASISFRVPLLEREARVCARDVVSLASEAGQGAVIDRVIKHLAILLAESPVAEGKGERPTIFITRFNLTAIASTGD